MVELVSDSLFRIFGAMIATRDILVNLDKVIKEIGIKQRDIVLDYGCGLGSFTIPAARRAGDKGKVYALDIHPLALKRTEKKAKRKKITNIEYILSDCDTGLNEGSVDVVLFYAKKLTCAPETTKRITQNIEARRNSLCKGYSLR